MQTIISESQDCDNLNSVKELAKKLNEKYAEFRKSLNEKDIPGIALISPITTISPYRLKNIQCIEPSLIVFNVVDRTGIDIELFQHISQLNFYFTVV